MPKFNNEAEEAEWFFQHQDDLEDYLETPTPSDTARFEQELEEVRARRSKPITIRLLAEDIETAKQIAAKKGIGYQTYLKMILHEGLEREKGKAS
jgi:predicted DNA binding CopG/RHH family protein